MEQSPPMLLLICSSALVYLAMVLTTALEVGGFVGQVLDGHVSREYHEQGVDGYVQVVVLPLLGALAGGLLGASIQSVADAVVAAGAPSLRFVYVTSSELLLGLGLASVLPVMIRRRYARVAESSIAGRLYSVRRSPERLEKTCLVADIRHEMDVARRRSVRGARGLVVLVVVATGLLAARIVVSEVDPSAGGHPGRSVGLYLLYVGIALAGRFVLRPLTARRRVARLVAYERRALSIRTHDGSGPRSRRAHAHRRRPALVQARRGPTPRRLGEPDRPLARSDTSATVWSSGAPSDV